MSTKSVLFQNLVDFEYNKYMLLGLLKKAENSFEQNKLFPIYQQLRSEYNQLIELKSTLEQMIDLFPKEIDILDIKNQQTIFKNKNIISPGMEDIHMLVEYSIPKLKHMIDTGKHLHDTIKENMSFRSVGIEPMYKKEGLLLIYDAQHITHHVFTYSLHVIENVQEHFVDFKTEYLKSYSNKALWTSENIKYEFMKENSKDFPLPATFEVYYELNAPVFETSLPIAREFIIDYVYST